jgi:hypothetical protein
MTTTTTNTPNGRAARKSLAEQIDRLDTVLDGLSDGLQEAVTQAVQAAVETAVREAVRSVLTEIVTNPAVLDRLRAQLVPPTPAPAEVPAPSPTEAPASTAVRPGWRMWSWVSTRLRAMGRIATATIDQLRAGVAAVRQQLEMVRPHAKPLLVAAGVGVLVGVLAYLAGPWLSALGSAVGGFVTTLAVQAGFWFRRTMGALPRWDA